MSSLLGVAAEARVRLGFGEDFTVAYDFATSNKTGLQVYIGLGYLY